MPFSSGTRPVFKPTMCFIDGGHLRTYTRELFDHDNIDFEALHMNFAQKIVEHGFHPAFIRIYYYDAIVEEKEPEHDEQKAYFDKINSLPFYEVKLGRLIKDSNGIPRQKGVDVLLSIDMLQKAHQHQYEWAVLVAGDDDYVDLVNAVKNVGKRVYAFYFDKHTSPRLKAAADWRCAIDQDETLLNILRSRK